MEAPVLRDLERDTERHGERQRWKDRIEVRLDNRQVFFLFFGSAMVACMLFVLGVIVGKRLESRGRAETTTPVDDPLAVLDRLGPPAGGASSGTGAPAPVAHAALTFPKTLIGNNKVASATRNERAASARAARPILTATGPGVGPARMVVAVTETPAPESSRTGAAGPLTTKPPVAGKPPATAKPAPRPTAAVSPPSQRTPSRSPTEDVAELARTSAPAAAAAQTTTDRPRGHFLLQLSSFQDRTEAEAFARRFPGQNAYIVTTELPGKGTWYRVRVGDFGTMQEASVAKTAFERAHNVIAYVAGTGPAH